VDKAICLCDCPGLVFPSFVSTKAEMVVSGILPIDQLRDHVPPVALISFYETVFPEDIEAEVLPSSPKHFIMLI
jgi:ribosome biogenesis GTPase A